jgi:hypothetical protein
VLWEGVDVCVGGMCAELVRVCARFLQYTCTTVCTVLLLPANSALLQVKGVRDDSSDLGSFQGYQPGPGCTLSLPPVDLLQWSPSHVLLR